VNLYSEKNQSNKLFPISDKNMFKGFELALSLAYKRLDNSKLLLKSDFPYDAFILYSFSYEEFGKALIIKEFIEQKEKGLPTWLFKGKSAHKEKMQRAKGNLPFQCSYFSPGIRISNANDEGTIHRFKVWRGKDVHERTIYSPASSTGMFEDVTNLLPSHFDELTREEFLYVNWDPVNNEWHTTSDYIIGELERAIVLLQEKIVELAVQNNLNL
jgi:AbiV family abortive infection protein